MKILSVEYGCKEVITPGRADWLSDVICIDRTNSRFTPEEEAVVNSGVNIRVPKWMVLHIQKQGLRIGVVIHRLHRENLSRQMAACANRFPGKGQAMAALRDFYDFYELEDDDLMQESAYREYSRFRKKFLTKNRTIKARHVLPQSRFLQRPELCGERINQEQLDLLCDHFKELSSKARLRRTDMLIRHVHRYIYYTRGGRDIPALVRRFKVARANVYHSLSIIRNRIKRDKRFAQVISQVIDPSFVLSEP